MGLSDTASGSYINTFGQLENTVSNARSDLSQLEALFKEDIEPIDLGVSTNPQRNEAISERMKTLLFLQTQLDNRQCVTKENLIRQLQGYNQNIFDSFSSTTMVKQGGLFSKYAPVTKAMHVFDTIVMPVEEPKSLFAWLFISPGQEYKLSIKYNETYLAGYQFHIDPEELNGCSNKRQSHVAFAKKLINDQLLLLSEEQMQFKTALLLKEFYDDAISFKNDLHDLTLVLSKTSDSKQMIFDDYQYRCSKYKIKDQMSALVAKKIRISPLISVEQNEKLARDIKHLDIIQHHLMEISTSIGLDDVINNWQIRYRPQNFKIKAILSSAIFMMSVTIGIGIFLATPHFTLCACAVIFFGATYGLDRCGFFSHHQPEAQHFQEQSLDTPGYST